MKKDIIDWESLKAKKDGVVTSKALLEKTLQYADEFQQVVIVTVDKEGGYIRTGWSERGSIETIGLLEMAKRQIMDGMYE